MNIRISSVPILESVSVIESSPSNLHTISPIHQPYYHISEQPIELELVITGDVDSKFELESIITDEVASTLFFGPLPLETETTEDRSNNRGLGEYHYKINKY